MLTHSSDENSQPSVVVQGDRTLSPARSDDTFEPFGDDLQDITQRNDSPPGGDQQQGDAQQGQVSGEWQRYPELQLDRPIHEVRQEALEHHPELKMRAPQVTLDTSSDIEEELALMSIPNVNVIPTFLTLATERIEPFEPKTLQQAKNNASWLEWERAMLDEVNSTKTKRGSLLILPKIVGFLAENGSTKSSEDRMAKPSATKVDGL